MKKRSIVLIIAFLLPVMAGFTQSAPAENKVEIVLKEYKAGNCFNVSLPDYMNRTYGLNDAAAIQFKNSLKDVAGFIIDDSKEQLKLADMIFSSVNEFYDNFIKDFLVNEKTRNISQPKSASIGNTNFIETDASYYDKESKLEIYYFVGIAETSGAFYKVLCFCSLENKDKFKNDFQLILHSIKD